MNVGVIVGRFQVPFLTEGHLDLIKHVLNENDTVIIVIGETKNKVRNEKNLFSVNFRKELLYVQLQNYYDRISIVSLEDRDSDKEWDDALDELCSWRMVTGTNIRMYGNRDSFLRTYNGIFTKHEYHPKIHTSGAEIRKKYLTILP